MLKLGFILSKTRLTYIVRKATKIACRRIDARSKYSGRSFLDVAIRGACNGSRRYEGDVDRAASTSYVQRDYYGSTMASRHLPRYTCFI